MEVRVIKKDTRHFPQIMMGEAWRTFDVSFEDRGKAWDWLRPRFPEAGAFRNLSPEGVVERFDSFTKKLRTFLEEHAGEYVAPDHGLVINYTPEQTNPEWPVLWIQSSEVVPSDLGGTDLMEQGPYNWSSEVPEEPAVLHKLELGG